MTGERVDSSREGHPDASKAIVEGGAKDITGGVVGSGTVKEKPDNDFKVLLQGKDSDMFVSYRTKQMIDVYVDNRGLINKTISDCKRLFGKACRPETLKKVLKYTPVREYIAKKLIAIGYSYKTKEEWLAETLLFRDGKKPSDKNTRFFHEMYGKAMGFLEVENKGDSIENLQINLVQANGEE